jgi:asparagine synthase (glutamine-hydrolysing)
MCGIAGIAGNRAKLEVSGVRRMIETLARRGPDGEGVEVWPSAVLGHRRLAIFDLSEAGRQPMVSTDRKIGVVFNGAIYNFKELRRELEGRGYTFRSATDTEVLIHGYREWSIEGLVKRLRGMFAFGLWDDEDEVLYLVRDRLGVKPLIFVEDRNGISFASTVRALREAELVAEVDDEAVAEFLRFGYVTDFRAIYRGARKVPAASIVAWRQGKLSTTQYWSPTPQTVERRVSFDEALEETERLFLESVALRLQADVPVGVLLSSGIDSSLVCWAVAKLGADITAFTVGVPNDPWDETVGARATAEAIGIAHRVLPMAELSISALGELTAAYAEPFACASALGMLGVSRAVREEATVLLTGDGGDDVFLGYPRHRHLLLAQQIARLLPHGTTTLWPAVRLAIPSSGPFRRVRSLVDYAIGGQAAFEAAGGSLSFYRKNGILGPRFADSRGSWSSPLPLSATANGKRALNDYLEHAYRTQFVGEYMTKVDGATMHFGLEARSPFLDQDLWTFVGSLPPLLRLRGYRLKALLRALAAKRIGSATSKRRKMGFGIPVHRWLANGWYEDARSVWKHSALHEQGWIDAGAVARAFAHARTNGVAPMPLWYLFVLEMWLRYERSAANRNRESLGARRAGLVSDGFAATAVAGTASDSLG